MARRKSRFREKAEKIKAQVTREATDHIRRIHKAMMEELVDQTRVDSGVLRANWVPSLNAPSDEWSSFGIPIGNLADYPRGEQLSVGFAVEQATDIGDFKLGDVIINTNNVPYGQEFLKEDLVGVRSLMLLAAEQEAKKKKK